MSRGKAAGDDGIPNVAGQNVTDLQNNFPLDVT